MVPYFESPQDGCEVSLSYREQVEEWTKNAVTVSDEELLRDFRYAANSNYESEIAKAEAYYEALLHRLSVVDRVKDFFEGGGWACFARNLLSAVGYAAEYNRGAWNLHGVYRRPLG